MKTNDNALAQRKVDLDEAAAKSHRFPVKLAKALLSAGSSVGGPLGALATTAVNDAIQNREREQLSKFLDELAAYAQTSQQAIIDLEEQVLLLATELAIKSHEKWKPKTIARLVSVFSKRPGDLHIYVILEYISSLNDYDISIFIRCAPKEISIKAIEHEIFSSLTHLEDSSAEAAAMREFSLNKLTRFGLISDRTDSAGIVSLTTLGERVLETFY